MKKLVKKLYEWIYKDEIYNHKVLTTLKKEKAKMQAHKASAALYFKTDEHSRLTQWLDECKKSINEI